MAKRELQQNDSLVNGYRRGGPPSRPPSASVGPFGGYSAEESVNVGKWALTAVDRAVASYSADLREVDGLQGRLHPEARIHRTGHAVVDAYDATAGGPTNRRRVEAVRAELGAGIAGRQVPYSCNNPYGESLQ